MMIRITLSLLTIIAAMSSCRSTRKIQTAVVPKSKDTIAIVTMPIENRRDDSLKFISDTYNAVQKNHIDFTTFSARITVDYRDASGKKDNVTVHLKMYKDSAVWISVTGLFGFEGLRAFITTDSVRIINKLQKTYTVRSVGYLQEVTALPLDLRSLQDLMIGNTVFFGSNIVSYSRGDIAVSLLHIGDFFKNLLTVDAGSGQLQSSKLDDLNEFRNRTCYLTYRGYENKKRQHFSTRREITVTEKETLNIDMDFKQYEFNQPVNFPFPMPGNYKLN
jgi:hypothetical protein